MHLMNTPLRIAMLSLHSSPIGELGTQDTGGMSVYIREISRELGLAGHRVDIYTCAEADGCGREITLSENVRLIHLSIGKNGHVPKKSLYPYLPEFSTALEGYLSANRLSYDLIHSHYWLSGWVGAWAQLRWNLPHVLTFHTTGMAKRVYCFQEREPFLRLVSEKRLAHKSDRILVPTEGERDLLVKFYGAPGEKIGVIPCGVNLNRFRPVRNGIMRRRLGVEEASFVVLFVGRFAPLKGVERLLAAIGHLRRYNRLRLVIVGGDGPQSSACSELARTARRLGIHHAVRFAGRVDHDDLPAYYSDADVLAVPSYYESFGLVMLESLACGTPVVATPVGATERVIREGQTGTVVRDPSPRSLASAIERFILQPGRSRLPREQIRDSVLKHCWSNTATAVAHEYFALIRAGTAMPSREVKCDRAC